MDSVKRFATFIYIIVSVLSGCGHCQVVIQGPSNTTVLVGSQARFNCTVEGPWITIFWFMKRTPILTVSSDQGVTTPHKRFSAVNYTRASSFTSELIISDVRISDTGTIECNIFSSEFFTAYLSVEVNGTLQITNGSFTTVINEITYVVCQASGWLPAPHITWMTNNSPVDSFNYVTTQHSVGSEGLQNAVSTLNMTFGENSTVTCLASIEALSTPQSTTVTVTVSEHPVVNSNSLDQRDVIIIAVTVSIGGLLLIILIILLIIFCCRRRKKEESSYQSQLKKVSAQRANNVSTISKSSAMKADLGDHEEEPATRRPLPKTPSEASSISNSFGAEQNLGRYTTHVRGLNNGAFYPGYDSTNPQKVRHLTHV
ncbi:immunoglobulin superfamily member 5 isoform X1 [Lissotriton helveticus]